LSCSDNNSSDSTSNKGGSSSSSSSKQGNMGVAAQDQGRLQWQAQTSQQQQRQMAGGVWALPTHTKAALGWASPTWMPRQRMLQHSCEHLGSLTLGTGGLKCLGNSQV
jgi:hypothetical protein